MRSIFKHLTPLVLAVGLVFIPYAVAEAAATRSDSGAAPGQDRSFEFGQQAVQKEDWPEAIKQLERAVRVNARSADAFNLLAYSYRRSGNLDKAFANYDKALDLDPKHQGAHEYIGEAYLMIGEPELAQEHLTILKEICGDDCKETSTLRKAIVRYQEGADKQASIGADDDLW